MSCLVVGDVRLPASNPRYLTPVVTGILGKGESAGVKVSGTVNGLNAFWIGTLMPVGLNPVPNLV